MSEPSVNSDPSIPNPLVGASDRQWWSKDVWAVTLVVICATALFGFSAFVDPEPHHDGIQLAPAIAVANGKLIHAEVFDQYGPITAWIHGIVIFIFGPTLLDQVSPPCSSWDAP